MKITTIDAVDLPQVLAMSPFSYERFCDEKARETVEELSPEPEYLYVAAGVVDERPEEQWNTLGRAVWNRDNIRRTATGVSELLELLGAEGFVVKHKGNPQTWFTPELANDGRAAAKIAFLRRHGVNLDLTTWVGGFLIEGDSLPFIDEFLDYSHVFHRWPLEMVCRNRPLMVGLDYDLYVYWVSCDRSLLGRVTRELSQRSLLFAPSPYLPDLEG